MTDSDYLFALFDGNRMSVETDTGYEPEVAPPATHEFVRNDWDNGEQVFYGLYALPSTADGPSMITDRDPKWIRMRLVVNRWRIVSDWQQGEPPQEARDA